MTPEELPVTMNETQAAEGPRAIAPWWHTALVLTQLVALALIGPRSARNQFNEPHALLYTAGIMSQWLQLSAVVAGLYHRRQFFIDALRGGKGTWRSEAWRGVGLYLVTIVAFGIATAALHHTRHQPGFDREVIRAIAPTSAAELLLWLGLSVVVGFCEELVFRGYLLRQMVAWGRGVGASPFVAASGAVLITSVLFGSLHVYEGAGGAILIGILGAMYAVVALRRGNLRAVIVAHALQDSVAMVFLMARHAHNTR